jgi:hypothetical protein
MGEKGGHEVQIMSVLHLRRSDLLKLRGHLLSYSTTCGRVITVRLLRAALLRISIIAKASPLETRYGFSARDGRDEKLFLSDFFL